MNAVSFVPDQPAAKVHASLHRSLQAVEKAQECAVLWFAAIMGRHLYRDLGFSSINQYAQKELGFSRTRTGDFVRLAQQLGHLPKVKKALSEGDMGYTKARETLPVVSPETEDEWLQAARGTRRELVEEVKEVRLAAKVDPNQGDLLPKPSLVVTPKEIPVRFQVDLTPEQGARRAALVDRLHKLGGVPKDRAELMLEALAALVESREMPPGGSSPIGLRSRFMSMKPLAA